MDPEAYSLVGLWAEDHRFWFSHGVLYNPHANPVRMILSGTHFTDRNTRVFVSLAPKSVFY